MNATSKNPRLNVNMINREYLEHLDNIFGILSRGVSIKSTAEQAAKYDKSNGWNKGAKAENYHDKYRFTTSTHPDFKELRKWYDSGAKLWPEDLELTPLVLKHWYVGDGTFTQQGQIRISMVKEKENKDKVASYFSKAGLPEMNGWTEFGESRCSAIWNQSEAEELFEYMGEPVDGFKYKWPEQ